MKRKLLLFTALVMFSPLIFGQTFVWEAFNAGQMPPTGWTFDGYASNWSVGNSNNAGGDPPEAVFTYSSANSTSRFISPTLDLTGHTSIKLNFWHMYDDFTGAGPKVGVATRSNGGAWNIVWEINPTSNVPSTQVDLTINNSDVGSSTFQFCFYVTGNFYNLDYWYLDNILVYNPLNLDAGITGITTPLYIGGPSPVTGQIMNFGTSTINSAEINWQLDAGPVFSSSFTGLSLPSLGTYDFTSTDLISTTIGTHTLTAWVNKVNGDVDDDQGNDTLSKDINKVSHVVPNKPLFEEFTSSTCSPCAAFNTTFVPWCQSHDDSITLVKYQMNWPSPGDPYYTAEGGVRRDYYGCNFVPDLYLGGSQIATDVGAVQAGFEQALLKSGLVQIASSHTITGTTINVNTTVLPFANFPDVRIYIIVFEYVTTGNVGSNGETEFHHVMMKMIPDGYGTTASLVDRVPFTITQSVDLSSTNVEEYNDLGVAILVQDYSSKQVFQSAYSVQDGSFNTEARLQLIQMDGATLTGFDPDVFNYDVNLPQGTTVVPDITADPMDPNATVVIVPAATLPGTTTIDVFAENLVNHNLYSVNFILPGIGINENPEQSVSVYPNPTRGLIYILNAYGSKVSVYSADGSTLQTVDHLAGNSLDLTGYTQGVYFIVIEKPDHSVIRKKVVIL
jgi:hypothetical protein